MLIGAIDIGSNAMRFLVASATQFEGNAEYERVEYLRYPIRLGEDVFTNKKISHHKIEKLLKMLSAFKSMFEVFDVVGFHCCATSAMRDAENSMEIINLIYKELGMEIEILSGDREAKLIEKAIHSYLDKGNYIHIDVGGGSTEITIMSDCEKLASQSFNIGTVRAIHHGISDEKWYEVEKWVKGHKINHLAGIGTGGNIKKLYELSDIKAATALPTTELEQLLTAMKSISVEERMQKYKLNDDRADVIVHAALIFSKILHWAESDKIFAPNVGLIDGIALAMWENYNSKEK